MRVLVLLGVYNRLDAVDPQVAAPVRAPELQPNASSGGRLITAQEFDTHVSQLVTRGRLNQSSRWTRIQFGDERVEGRPEYSIWSGDMWGSYLFDPMTVLSAVQVSAAVLAMRYVVVQPHNVLNCIAIAGLLWPLSLFASIPIWGFAPGHLYWLAFLFRWALEVGGMAAPVLYVLLDAKQPEKRKEYIAIWIYIVLSINVLNEGFSNWWAYSSVITGLNAFTSFTLSASLAVNGYNYFHVQQGKLLLIRLNTIYSPVTSISFVLLYVEWNVIHRSTFSLRKTFGELAMWLGMLMAQNDDPIPQPIEAYWVFTRCIACGIYTTVGMVFGTCPPIIRGWRLTETNVLHVHGDGFVFFVTCFVLVHGCIHLFWSCEALYRKKPPYGRFGPIPVISKLSAGDGSASDSGGADEAGDAYLSYQSDVSAVYCVILGQDYEDSETPLKCSADSRRVAQLACACDAYEVALQHDGSREAAAALIEKVGAQCRAKDTFVLFFAGHALRTGETDKDDGDAALCFLDRTADSAMTLEGVRELLLKTLGPDVRVLILLDLHSSEPVIDLGKESWKERHAMGMYACRDYDADAAEGGWQGGLLTGLLVDTLEELVFVSAPKKLFAAQVVATMNASQTFKRLSAVPSAKLGVTKTQRCNPVSFRWPFCPPGGFTAKSTLQLEATKFKEKKVQFKTKHKNFFSRLFRSKKSLELVESSSDSEDVQQT